VDLVGTEVHTQQVSSADIYHWQDLGLAKRGVAK